MIKIHTLSGYDEVGKNMTALEIGEDIIVFDCGLYLPAVIDLQETEKLPTPKMLKEAGAFPDDSYLARNKHRVRAFLVTHAHLDHVGALHYIAKNYPNAEIFGTPFTNEVLKSLMEDSRMNLKNKITNVKPDRECFVKGKSGKYKVDFVNMTHSTIQSAMIAVHTPEGVVVYANDYKLDNNPVIGNPPNYAKMRELAKKGVKALIVDSLYAKDNRKTHSEKIARAMVEEALMTVNHKNSGIIVTTFSSHIARLKSIVEFSRKIGRKPVFFGRSLMKYVNAAKKIGECDFAKDIEIHGYQNQVKSKLKQIDKSRHEYVIVCTGHQAEPGSILDRIVKNDLPFKFHSQDSVIFSSSVIPVPVNQANRAAMDKKIRMKDVRIFDDVHVSGHGGREDLRDMINLLKPRHLIPSHGGLDKTTPAVELAKEMGYKYGETAHLCQDGKVVMIK